MTYRQVDLVEVRAWGRTVGAVAPDPGTGVYAFEYDPAWARSGADLAPLTMPNGPGTFVFPQLDPRTYYRLPAMLADSLPDRFGNALVNAWLTDHGVAPGRITALDRLAYAAGRAMGALTFHPPADAPATGSTALALADLVSAARATVHGSTDSTAAAHEALLRLIQVGTSAGGARAKAVVGYNPDTHQICSGQDDVPAGFEHWLVKLDGVSGDPGGEEDPLGEAGPWCRVEFAYWLMARAAGVRMTECRLLAEGPRAHFLTRRFDRLPGGGRIHVQTLCAMAQLDFNLAGAHSYSQYLATVARLGIGPDALGQAFRRMVFNVAAVNRDDHTKNLSFTLPEGGSWGLAPAYDLTHAHNPSGVWTARHQMSVNGKVDQITRADVEAVGDRHLVPGYRGVIEDVVQAVRRWPEFAAAAGLGDAVTVRISSDLALHGLKPA